MENFKRGYVSWAEVPKSQHTVSTPEPGFILHGRHMVVTLHDQGHPDLKPGSVLVLPITSATAEVNKALKEGRNIRPSYVPISKKDHPFLEQDSYISTGQIMPLNEEWLDQYIGNLSNGCMEDVDLQVVTNLGLMDYIMKLSTSIYGDLIAQSEAAAASQLNSNK
ncbi:type II toxin-antitoxin system PemK/MazF family toxin [Paenibacillus taichungensis]|uniref:type II toxin-antitoxin system PemK/MazF family toxin n=1 Tax=Paenibacillus taichungensis TaxID=484184 RepID=UPI0035DC8A25